MGAYGTNDIIRELEQENRELKERQDALLTALTAGSTPVQLLSVLDDVIPTLEKMRHDACAYGQFSPCDCKYGYIKATEAARKRENNGCPELRAAIMVLLEVKNHAQKLRVCNRKACNNRGADHWNLHTRAYYCKDCAHKINEANNDKVCVLKE